MDNSNTNNTEQQAEVKPMVKVNKSKNILWPVVTLLILGAGTGAYFWRDSQANKNKSENTKTITTLNEKIVALEKQITESKTTANNFACTTLTASTIENITASITSKNSAALEGFMSDSVKVVIAATEASFDRTPVKAIVDLKYVINATAPWDFALNAATLDTYKAGFYKEYFKDNSIVGVAADKKIVVFNFNCAGKINGVFMAISSELLTE